MTAGTRLTHAYMLTGPAGPERTRAREDLCAALLCEQADAPCRRCRSCRKVYAGTHPDVIVIERLKDDKGRLRQELLVGQIRAAAADAFVAPNESARKVYVIPEAERMNTEAQNALLKALEDPPGHACFVLCTTAADALLPTVRSRCVRVDETVRTDALPPLTPHAQEFIALCARGDIAGMTKFCFLRAKMSREDTDALLSEIEDALADILCGRRPDPGLSPARALTTASRLEHAREMLRRYISPKQVFGLLAAQFDLGESHDRRD